MALPVYADVEVMGDVEVQGDTELHGKVVLDGNVTIDGEDKVVTINTEQIQFNHGNIKHSEEQGMVWTIDDNINFTLQYNNGLTISLNQNQGYIKNSKGTTLIAFTSQGVFQSNQMKLQTLEATESIEANSITSDELIICTNKIIFEDLTNKRTNILSVPIDKRTKNVSIICQDKAQNKEETYYLLSSKYELGMNDYVVNSVTHDLYYVYGENEERDTETSHCDVLTYASGKKELVIYGRGSYSKMVVNGINLGEADKTSENSQIIIVFSYIQFNENYHIIKSASYDAKNQKLTLIASGGSVADDVTNKNIYARLWVI